MFSRRHSERDERFTYYGPRAQWVENWLNKCNKPGNISYKVLSFIPVLVGAAQHTAYQYMGGYYSEVTYSGSHSGQSTPPVLFSPEQPQANSPSRRQER